MLLRSPVSLEYPTGKQRRRRPTTDERFELFRAFTLPSEGFRTRIKARWHKSTPTSAALGRAWEKSKVTEFVNFSPPWRPSCETWFAVRRKGVLRFCFELCQHCKHSLLDIQFRIPNILGCMLARGGETRNWKSGFPSCLTFCGGIFCGNTTSVGCCLVTSFP